MLLKHEKRYRPISIWTSSLPGRIKASSIMSFLFVIPANMCTMTHDVTVHFIFPYFILFII